MPLAFSSRRSSETATVWALRSRARDAALRVRTLGGGPFGIERRSGGCCVSQATSGFSGGRSRIGGGLLPTIGSATLPKIPLPRFSVSAPPVPRTLKYCPLASNERLSPARPGRNFARSW